MCIRDRLGTVPAGIARRGYCYGAPTTDLDGQVAKNWEIREKYRIKFSLDFFDPVSYTHLFFYSGRNDKLDANDWESNRCV